MKTTLSFKLFAFLLILPFHSIFATDIWKNDFFTQIDKGYWGTSSDLEGVDWSLDVTNCIFSDDNDYVKVVSTSDGRLEAVDCDGEAVWYSPVIDISSYLNCNISLKAGETGSSASLDKYIKVFYRIDDGDLIPFENNSSNIGNFGILFPTQSNVTGNSLQIIVRMSNPLSSSKVYIDDLVVEGELPDLGSTITTSTWSSEEAYLSSLSTSPDLAKEIFHFKVVDYTEDDLPTTITQMYFEAGSANSIDWEDTFEDFYLKVDDQILETIAEIDDDYVVITFSDTELERIIASGEEKEFALFVSVQEGEVTDQEILQVKISQSSAFWLCDESGSVFKNEFDAEIEGQQFINEVIASEMVFSDLPEFVSLGSVFSVQVDHIDQFGNIDRENDQSVSISIAAGTGSLSSQMSLEKQAENGICLWNDLTYDQAENFTIQAQSDQFPTILSDHISSVDQTSMIFTGEEIENMLLPGTAIDIDSAIPVLNFSIQDDASQDQLPTVITEMKFYKIEIENSFDWLKHIAGAVLYQNDNVIAQTDDIDSEFIRFYQSNGILSVENGTEMNLQIGIFFRQGGLPDRQKFQLKIPQEDYDWSSLTNSSQMNEILEGEIISSEMFIDIEVDRLNIVKSPFLITDSTQYFNLEIAAVDAFQNVDIDSDPDFQLSVVGEEGEIRFENSNGEINNGMISIDSIKYRGEEDFSLLTVSELQNDTCSVFMGEDLQEDIFDFENQSIDSFENTSDWAVSSYQPVVDQYSLKHNLIQQTGSSFIGLNLENLNPESSCTEWNFILRNGDWNPSSANRFCFHLLSNHPNPEQATYSFAVGVNYTSSDDCITLFKVEEGITTELLTSQFYWRENETVAMKVILDSYGKWTFFYNRLGEERNYTKVGEITDEIVLESLEWYSSLYFDFGTASRAGELWLDQLKIHTINTAPYLIDYVLANHNQIQLFFSEAIDIDDESSFILTKDDVEITDFEILLENQKEILIQTKDDFETGNYHLEIRNIADLLGEKLEFEEISFEYIKPAEISDIVINELLIDENPSVLLPEYEFIELYNRKDEPVVISNWKLQVGNYEATLSTDTLAAESYLILCANSAVDSYAGFGETMGVSSFPSLSNDAAIVRLISAENQMIDSISYHSNWYNNDDKSDGGWSLERIDPENTAWQEPNWSASEHEHGGTPGQENSIRAQNLDETLPELNFLTVVSDTTVRLDFSEPIEQTRALSTLNYSLVSQEENVESIQKSDLEGKIYLLEFSTAMIANQEYELEINNLQDLAGNSLEETNYSFWNPSEALVNDLVINEVLFNPYPEGADYVEIYNRSDKVLDLSKLSLATRDENYEIEDLVSLAGQQIYFHPESYFLFTTDTANVKEQYVTNNPIVFHELNSLPSYTNTEGRVVLLQGEEIVDDFAYHEKMHFDLLSSVEGVALERINPDLETNDENNWQSAAQNIGFGTPGLKNSAYNNAEIADTRVALSSSNFSPDNDGVDDRLYINFNLEEEAYVANVRIYNSKGKEIRKLASNLSLAINDQLYWDGLNADGQQLDVGIYLIYIELFNLNGKVKTYKMPCVLSLRFQ